MVVIGSDTNNGACTSPKKDTEQDIQIESLQTAIDTINSQITAINQTLAALSDSIDDKYSAQTQTLMSELNSRLTALTQALAQGVTTVQVNATIGNFERLAASLSAEIGNLSASVISITEKLTTADLESSSADIGELDTNNIDADVLTAQSAQIHSLVVDLLNMTSLSVTNLTAGTLTADSAKIDELESDVVKTDVVSGKDWKTPISTPDNTELLKITLPKYDGVICLVTQGNEFAVTVFNNSIVTYNELSEYIFRIERTNNGDTLVYLSNIGDTINYKVLRIGKETFMNDSSEIVDKTGIVQNVLGLTGTLLFFNSDNTELKIKSGFNELEQCFSNIASQLSLLLVAWYISDSNAFIFPDNLVSYNSSTKNLELLPPITVTKNGTNLIISGITIKTI